MAIATDDNMLVTANRTQQEQFTALSANTIITSEQIQTMQIGNVSELLDKVAGISVAAQGGSGQSSSVFMRGSNSNHTLILIDGVRVNSATLGTTNIAAISPNQIERIEIIKGPRGALWGSDALGGVIQIFTKKLESGEGKVTVGFGSNGLVQADAAIGFGNEEHNLTVSVSTESADGFNAYTTDALPYDINEDDDDGYTRKSINVVGQSQVNDLITLNLVGRYEDGNSEFDASYPDSPCWYDASEACPTFYANEQDTENYSVKLSSTYQAGNLLSEVSIAKSQDQGESYGNGILKSDADEIKTQRDQVSFTNQYTFSELTNVSLGLDYYNEQVSTNTDKDAWTPGFQSWSEDERDVSAVFLQAQHKYQDVLIEGAVRYDDVENLDSETTYNVSVGYQFNQDWLISLTRGTGFKAPTFNDLYWPGSGNADLNPEQITNNEVLIRHKFTQGQFELALFDSEIENLIAWAPNSEGVWQPDNINSAKIKGAEASAQIEAMGFNHYIAVTYIDAEDSNTGTALLRRPEITANYNLSYDWQDLTLTADVTYRDESLDSGAVTLDSYVLVDFGARYQVNDKIHANIKVNNLFDEEYETSANYIADGTNYKASITYTF